MVFDRQLETQDHQRFRQFCTSNMFLFFFPETSSERTKKKKLKVFYFITMVYGQKLRDRIIYDSVMR